MQDYSLTVDKFLDHAARWCPDGEVIGIDDCGASRRFDYAAIRDRANRLSGALLSIGMKAGDRIATLAWNSVEHFECYYGTMGVGMICHTLNPRLSEDHLVAIVEEAQDRLIAVSADLLPLAETLAGRCRSVERLLVLPTSSGSHEPQASATPVDRYDDFVARHGTAADWGRMDERSGAGLCYTSGTTSDPKGVLYTHRSNYLHTLRALQADALAIDARDTLLLAVPMFHANGWGIPFAAPAVGSRLVLPGRHLDGQRLAQAIVDHGVTVAVGVQTVWLGLADHVEAAGCALPSLKRILIGGSSCPPALIERLSRVLDVEVQTSWGMTELSPIGTIAPPGTAGDGMASGRPAMGLDLLLTDADGKPLEDQLERVGHLKVRGASVVDRYYHSSESQLDADGYFATGDLAIIHANGALTISGRSKDLIKSGGEWINPADIEQVAGSHPLVRHVAVIGREDARWGERPIMIVEAEGVARDVSGDIMIMLKEQFASWWLPDTIDFIDAMPLAATGKVDKQALRTIYSSPRERAAG